MKLLKNKLYIIGASGHGKVILDIACKLNRWDEIAFFDSDNTKKECLGYKVIGKVCDIWSQLDDVDIIVAIGNNSIRKELHLKLMENRASLPILVHPNAVIGLNVNIGAGTVIMAGAVINSDTTIGQSCIINTGSTVDHDNEVGDYVHISPGVNLAGNVKVGNESWICIGSKVSNNVEIAENVIVGAGSVVLTDISSQGKYYGIPARRSGL